MDLAAATAVHEWNLPRWRAVRAQMAQLPHALLLAGSEGLGKNAFATRLAATLLCAQPTDAGPCGSCKSCSLFAAGTHPDLNRVTPAETGKAIVIDQIRALGEFLALKPHTASRKVVVLSPADAMNTFAANSLLKILEEPPLGSYLILVAAHPGRLPATVRSRCMRLAFHAPAAAEGQAWLQAQSLPAEKTGLLLDLADRAPLRALSLHAGDFLGLREGLLQDTEDLAAARSEVVACAARWKKAGAMVSLGWLQGYCADLVRVKTTARPPRLFNPDLGPTLQARANRLNLDQLLAFFGTVTQNYRRSGESLDEQLLLEETLISWVRLNRQSS